MLRGQRSPSPSAASLQALLVGRQGTSARYTLEADAFNRAEWPKRKLIKYEILRIRSYSLEQSINTAITLII